MTDLGDRIPASERCPCLSGEVYGLCCRPFHRGEAQAPTAERLMRSRYSAFAVGEADYLVQSWHPSTRPDVLELDPAQQWRRLDILSTERGGMLDTEGVVEFRAYFRRNGVPGQVHEVSRFLRAGGHWYYLDGVVDS